MVKDHVNIAQLKYELSVAFMDDRAMSIGYEMKKLVKKHVLGLCRSLLAHENRILDPLAEA